MKVLQLGPYPPPHGGVQTNLVAIRRYLHARGHECEVINLTRHRREDSDGVYYPRTPIEVLKLLARLRYDIAHYHLGGNVTTRLLGLCLACSLMPGRRAVLTFHSGGYPLSAAGRRARPLSLRGFVFRRFDKIIAVNQTIVEMFRRFGVASNKIHLIEPHALAAAPAAVALPDDLHSFYAAHDPVLLTVGLLEPEYGLALQVEAMARVREKFPRAGLVIIGSGSIEAELRALIASKPYAADLLLCGDVAHERTLRAISDCDLFLRTTHYDGDSISVREALHAGVPVIATDNGMRPAGVRLIPKADEAALVAAVEESLTKERHGGGDGEAEQDEARVPEVDEKEADRNVAAVFELYRELVEGEKGGAL
ncbi:MAG TPA: glycosyltransferase family 4 protein [Pyrinomonadaceae bacterium]|nr:glycosyltransferase family 4 protein [Pyrinomonadaceae bacterium]